MKSAIAVFGFMLISLSLKAAPVTYSGSSSDYYLQATSGFVLSTDADVSTSLSPNKTDIGFDDAISMTIAAGKHFRPFRLELEYSLRSPDYETDVTFDTTKFVGDLTYNSLMINGLYEAPLSDRIYFFTGVGIGASRVEMELSTGNDEEFAFAFQGIIGLGVRLAENFSIVGGYRVFWTTGTEFSIQDDQGATQTFDTDSPIQSVFEIGVRYDF